jgi:hypothetical protein
MKKIINFVIIILSVGLISSCSSTGTMMGASSGYGYYDNVYHHGYPAYYGANSYLYPRSRVIHNNIIVLPEQKKVKNRQVQRREAVSPNTRRKVTTTSPNRTVNRSSTPVRRGSTVAPSSRSTRSSSAPASRAPSSRRGVN